MCKKGKKEEEDKDEDELEEIFCGRALDPSIGLFSDSSVCEEIDPSSPLTHTYIQRAANKNIYDAAGAAPSEAGCCLPLAIRRASLAFEATN